MKNIYLIYNQLCNNYVINEKAMANDNNALIVKTLDDVANHFRQYGKRKICAVTKIPDADIEILSKELCNSRIEFKKYGIKEKARK